MTIAKSLLFLLFLLFALLFLLGEGNILLGNSFDISDFAVSNDPFGILNSLVSKVNVCNLIDGDGKGGLLGGVDDLHFSLCLFLFFSQEEEPDEGADNENRCGNDDDKEPGLHLCLK